MESFPVQSPETGIDDDDDESPESESPRDRRESRDTAKDEARHEEKPESVSEAAEETAIAKPENQEGEIPLESLADDELRLVAQQYIDHRAEALRTELVNVSENSPDEAAVLANATMLETIEAKLSQGETPGERTVEDAVSETAQELEIDEPASEAEPITGEVTDNELPDEPEETNSQPAVIDPANAPATTVSAGTANNPNTPPPNSQAVPGAPGPGPAPISPNYSGGGNNLPPQYRVRGNGWVPPIIPNNNANTQPPSPNAAPPKAPENIIVKHNAAAPYLLLGYLIGRRRGRIKTEEKLLPVQKKLEKEVSDLHKNIAAGEEKIRKLAREKAETTPGAVAKMAEHIEDRKKLAESKADKTETSLAEKELTIKPEKLGKLAVTEDKPKAEHISIEEVKPKATEPLKVPERPKDPQNMSVAELLLIASHITIESGSLKKLYENNLITEQGLREATQSYLRGETYEKVINRNRVSGKTPEHRNFEENTNNESQHELNKTTKRSTANNVAIDYSADSIEGGTQSSTGHKADNSAHPDHKNDERTKSAPKAAVSALAAMAALAAIILLIFLLRR